MLAEVGEVWFGLSLEEIPADLRRAWTLSTSGSWPILRYLDVFRFPFSFYWISYWKNTFKKSILRETKGRSFCLGFSCSRKCVCQRSGVAAEAKWAMPNGQTNSKEKKVSSCPAGSSSVESFPEAPFCFCSLENSVILFWGHNWLSAFCGTS